MRKFDGRQLAFFTTFGKYFDVGLTGEQESQKAHPLVGASLLTLSNTRYWLGDLVGLELTDLMISERSGSVVLLV